MKAYFSVLAVILAACLVFVLFQAQTPSTSPNFRPVQLTMHTYDKIHMTTYLAAAGIDTLTGAKFIVGVLSAEGVGSDTCYVKQLTAGSAGKVIVQFRLPATVANPVYIPINCALDSTKVTITTIKGGMYAVYYRTTKY